MRFGQTRALQTAKGKMGVGLALALFGLVALLTAATGGKALTDILVCVLVTAAGGVLFWLGIRQDRAEKDQLRREMDEPAKKQ